MQKPRLSWIARAKLHSSCCSLEAAAVSSRLIRKKWGWCISLIVALTCLAAVLRINLYTLRSRLHCRGVVRLRVSSSTYESAEVVKASLPHTTQFEGWTVETLQQELPIWVLSLARAQDRRKAMMIKLKAAGVRKYEIIDAVDAKEGPAAVSEDELKKYTNTWKRHKGYKRQKHYSSKIAVDMSHFRLLERVAASNRSALILEDDAQLTGEKWLPDLLTTLQELPEDWEVLYLHAGLSGATTRGKSVSPHVVALRKTAGTIGYVATPAFARKALAVASNPRQNIWVDLVFTSFIEHQEVQAYMAEPPLVSHADGPSTVDYTARTLNLTVWERGWVTALGARRHRRLLLQHMLAQLQ